MGVFGPMYSRTLRRWTNITHGIGHKRNNMSDKLLFKKMLEFYHCLLPARKMSSNKQACSYSCYSPCDVSCPPPYANAWSQPCVTSCGDSRAVVYPPPVVITFPGPILSSCPQESIVGTSVPLEICNSGGYPCYSRRYPTYRRGSCGPC
nr:PREDICTED: feather keratin B-4-like [Pelecanus crispus]